MEEPAEVRRSRRHDLLPIEYVCTALNNLEMASFECNQFIDTVVLYMREKERGDREYDLSYLYNLNDRSSLSLSPPPLGALAF